MCEIKHMYYLYYRYGKVSPRHGWDYLESYLKTLHGCHGNKTMTRSQCFKDECIPSMADCYKSASAAHPFVASYDQNNHCQTRNSSTEYPKGVQCSN